MTASTIDPRLIQIWGQLTNICDAVGLRPFIRPLGRGVQFIVQTPDVYLPAESAPPDPDPTPTINISIGGRPVAPSAPAYGNPETSPTMEDLMVTPESIPDQEPSPRTLQPSRMTEILSRTSGLPAAYEPLSGRRFKLIELLPEPAPRVSPEDAGLMARLRGKAQTMASAHGTPELLTKAADRLHELLVGEETK